MRKDFLKVLLVAGLILAQAGMVQAAGFNIYEAGARATALGGAFTASADDGSALFYNAAGLSFQTGSSVSLNFMPVNPRFKFAGATTGTGDGPTAEVAHKSYLVPGAYYTNNNNEKIAFGIGVYAPFGLGVEWMDPFDFVGRQVSYDVDIKTVYVTPAVSFKIGDTLALAVGLDLATQELSLQKMTLHPTLGVNAIDTHIEGKSSLNATPSFGLMYRPVEKLSLGFMYHFQKTMKYEDKEITMQNMIDAGEAGYDWSHSLLTGLNGDVPTDELKPKLNSEFNLPSIMSFGASYNIAERFRIESNYVYFGWSHFEKLVMDFDIDAIDQEIVFNYEDAWQVRFGLDFAAIPEKLNVMAGFVYDTSPQPLEAVSPLLPDSDRQDYSFGLQYMTGNWDFTASYMAVIGEERTTIENGAPANPDPAYPSGSYKSVANIFGAGFGYHF